MSQEELKRFRRFYGIHQNQQYRPGDKEGYQE